MGGLQRLFLRITPIIMLICFICFGITYTFDRNETRQLTYLTHETINTGTQENPILIESYNFDMESYIQNIDVDILKRSVENTINVETYTEVIDTFNAIWEDGYNFGDGVQTIINAVILVVNSLIVPINIILVPIRIISGLLLTAFTLVGINIARETPIINFLNGILDYAAIPLIRPTYNSENVGEYFNGTKWEWKDFKYNIAGAGNTDQTTEANVYFTTESGGNYKKMSLHHTQTGYGTPQETKTITLTYTDTYNYQVIVYNYNSNNPDSNPWIYNDVKIFYINDNNDLSPLDFENLYDLLTKFATQIA